MNIFKKVLKNSTKYECSKCKQKIPKPKKGCEYMIYDFTKISAYEKGYFHEDCLNIVLDESIKHLEKVLVYYKTNTILFNPNDIIIKTPRSNNNNFT